MLFNGLLEIPSVTPISLFVKPCAKMHQYIRFPVGQLKSIFGGGHRIPFQPSLLEEEHDTRLLNVHLIGDDKGLHVE